MMKNGFWADATMVRCAAWFLEKDIMIISDDNDDLQCTTTISGNIDDSTVPTVGPQLYLGFARNHYQSILPSYPQEEEEDVLSEDVLPVEVVPQKELNENSIPSECPACGKSCQRVLTHISMSKACRAIVGEELLLSWRNISRKKTKSDYIDSEKSKETRMKYNESGKQVQNQANYRAKKKEEDPEELKANQRKWFKTWRNSNDEERRHRNFLENSKYGPIFICICCHRKLSRGNVTVFNESVESKMKIPLVDCIFDMDVYSNVTELKNGKEISPNNR